MNTFFPSIMLAAASTGDVKSILITFLLVVLGIVCLGGLYMLVERFWGPFPAPVRLVVGLVVLILLILWALNKFLP